MAKAKYPAYKPATISRLTPARRLSGDSMTPVLPPEGKAELEDRAFDLIRKANAFAGQVPIKNQLLLSGLIRWMNCYY